MEKVIHCGRIRSRDGFYSAIADISEESFGYNLDALHDVLSGFRGEIRLIDFELLEENLGGYAAKIKKVLENCAKENPYFTLSFGEE